MAPLRTRTLQLTTQQLEYLVAIDRADTWADAAADVGVSPSALSQGIAELERRLGVALFERDGRRRVPAPDHAEVLRYAERTVAATDDLARWIERRRGGSTGTIRLGLIDAAATHHFRDALRGFREAHPDVDIHLTVGPSGGLLRSLRRSELDLVGCIQPPETPPGIDVTTVLDDPLAVLAPESRTASSPARWGPWVTFPSGSHTRQLIADALRAAGADFDVVAESHQPEVLREMVLLDLGWTVLPLAGLGSIDGLRVVEPSLTSRRLVLARR
ncbi:MAG: LysR family transcriptional regulator, partial [Acidimicrobiales bacterium]|nr:LysR family transcriptional regulator [Acidimicrobiales bacterium]